MLTSLSEVLATGLRVSTIDEDMPIPEIAETIDKDLKPVLGSTLLTALQTAYDQSLLPPTVPPAQPNPVPNADLMTLLPYVQKPLAAFAYLNELPATHARITSAGVRRTSTDGMPTAFKWEYEKVETYLKERAHGSMETLLSFLDTNAATYAEWLEADLVNKRKFMLLKNGGHLAQFVPLQYPFLTWYRLLPILHEVTHSFIIANIGLAFYNELMGITNTDATTNPTDEQSIVLVGILQMALANLALSVAAEKMPARFTGEGFTVIAGGNNAANPNHADAEASVLKRMGKRYHTDGLMYLRRAINYANVVATNDGLFTIYKNSDHYNDPETALIDRKNAQRKTFRF